MKLRSLLVVILMVFVTQHVFSQRNYQSDYNRLGLQAGASLFNINTNNFTTKASYGFTAGFTTRGAFYNNFDLIYGVNFYSLNVDIEARQTAISQTEDVNFGMFGVQLNLFASYNIIGQHLTVELGPALQISSKLKSDDSKEDYIIQGYNTLRAKDIEDVNLININAVGGLTGGFENVRFWLQYQYGINNILNGLNDEGLEQLDTNAQDFKGNLSLINFGVVFYL